MPESSPPDGLSGSPSPWIRLSTVGSPPQSFDRILADMMRSNPLLLDGQGDGQNLIDFWLASLRQDSGDGVAPLSYVGKESLEVMLKHFPVSTWLENGGVQNRSRIHQLLDVWGDQARTLSWMGDVVVRLTEVLPSSAFTEWEALPDAKYRPANTFALFSSRLSDPYGSFWLSRGWVLPDLEPQQLAAADFSLFQKCVAEGWDTNRPTSPSDGTPRLWCLMDVLESEASKKKSRNPNLAEKKAYLKAIKGWLREQGQEATLKAWERANYWKRLKAPSLTCNDAKKVMVSLPIWSSLRDESGASPALVMLNRFPHLWLSKEWTSGVDLNAVDDQGRDLWFYILTSEANTLEQELKVHPGSTDELIKAYPPQSSPRGWLGDLLAQPPRAWSIQQSTSILPFLKPVTSIYKPALVPVLRVGTEEKQREWVSRLLTVSTDTLHISAGLYLLNRVTSLMFKETYDSLIPELRYLSCLGALLEGSSSAVMNMHSTFDRNNIHRPVFAEMHDLALGGLRFGERKECGVALPWCRAADKEWAMVHDFAFIVSEREGLKGSSRQPYPPKDLEVAWKQGLLSEVDDSNSEEDQTVPRL